MAKGINKTKKLANYLYEVGSLRKLVRAHRQSLFIDDLSDNIASHSYRVAMIGWFLANEEGANQNKVLTMCLFHDVAEARSNDHNWVHKRYVKVFEDEIVKDQLKNLPGNRKIKKTLKEYEERKTLEAKIAKDADLLDQVLLIKEHAWQGSNEAKSWSLDAHTKGLKTKTAKRLAKEIVKTKPSEWWSKIWTPKRR